MHTYFTDHYVAHTFDGGICGHGGTCANGECCECKGVHYFSTWSDLKPIDGNWKCSEKERAKLESFTLTKQSEGQLIIRELPGTNNYILGPFCFNSSKDVSASNYTVTIYNKEGKTIRTSNYTVCNQDGKAISLSGSRK